MIFSSLKKNESFRQVYNRGKSMANRQLVLYHLPNNMEENRVGFSISKKYGKAVERNKLRRRLKEILRKCEMDKAGYDFVFIARLGARELDYHALEKSVNHLFRKSGLIR